MTFLNYSVIMIKNVLDIIFTRQKSQVGGEER